MAFTPRSEGRISKAVQRVEREYVNPPTSAPRPRRGKHNVIFGKLDGALTQGGSATMSVWTDDPLADSGRNVTVYDWFLGDGEELAAGKKVKAEFICGKWYATWWESGAEAETQTVMTNFQVDGANQKLQKKTRSVKLKPAGDESGWTDVHTGSICP